MRFRTKGKQGFFGLKRFVLKLEEETRFFETKRNILMKKQKDLIHKLVANK